MPDDVNDSFKVLNAWINEINLERLVKVNRITLPVFPDLTTDVPFWSHYEHVLLTTHGGAAAADLLVAARSA